VCAGVFEGAFPEDSGDGWGEMCAAGTRIDAKAAHAHKGCSERLKFRIRTALEQKNGGAVGADGHGGWRGSGEESPDEFRGLFPCELMCGHRKLKRPVDL
jgi:hypothetical protein